MFEYLLAIYSTDIIFRKKITFVEKKMPDCTKGELGQTQILIWN